MRCLTFLVSIVAVLIACQNNPSPTTGEEIQTNGADKNEAVSNENRPTETMPSSPSGSSTASAEEAKARINGSNVTMRKDASVQSEKLGSFDSGEAVEVLETKNVDNENEAILTKPITVKGSGGEVSLPKGKAVVIDKYQQENNHYQVTYQDPQKGKLTAEIDASAVETITYSTWYRVKRANGETGWVLGKFLKIN
ncbi:MAG: hypothetical protein ACKVUS_12745 [Saprospiraceae bacterium]